MGINVIEQAKSLGKRQSKLEKTENKVMEEFERKND